MPLFVKSGAKTSIKHKDMVFVRGMEKRLSTRVKELNSKSQPVGAIHESPAETGNFISTTNSDSISMFVVNGRSKPLPYKTNSQSLRRAVACCRRKNKYFHHNKK